MKTTHLFILTSVVAGLTQPLTAATQTSELNAAERLTIDGGRQVVREENIKNSAWPRVSIQQFVEATPEEAAAVFTDYERQSTYIPGVKKSVISRRVAPAVTEVDYILSVPLFPDEDYTVRDSVSTYNGGASYRVDWTKVRARSTKDIVGSARFDPYRNLRTEKDGTLITYVNFVAPGQFLAGPLKGRAVKQVKKTVIAVVKQIEVGRSSARALLASQIAALVTALAG